MIMDEKHLQQILQQYSIYQQLLNQYREAEPEYLRIRDSLSESDRILLENYISLGGRVGSPQTEHRPLYIIEKTTRWVVFFYFFSSHRLIWLAFS